MSDSVAFIEIDFTARSEGVVFDTTLREVAQAEGLEGRGRFEPLIAPLAPGYLLEGLFEFLQGKKEGSYTIEIPAEKAFGKKDAKKIKLVSLGKFRKNEMNPYPGMEVEVDQMRGVVKSVSSGRVLVDFNHPMAGKTVEYTVELKRYVTDPGECFASLLNLIIGMPRTLVTATQSEKKLSVVVTLKEQVPGAMFSELARMGAELIDGIDEITVEQKIEP